MKLKLSKLFSFNKEKYDKYLELLPDFKKEQTQKFTTIVLTLLAVILLSIFAINPTLSTIANLQRQLDDAKFVSGKLEGKINNLSILQTKYNSIQSDLPTVFEAIPQNSNVSKLTGQIQSVARNNNLNIINFQATDLSSVSKFSYYSFTLSANGNYDSIVNFLTNLIDMQRIVYISSINMSKSEETNSGLQFNIQGEAFYKP